MTDKLRTLVLTVDAHLTWILHSVRVASTQHVVGDHTGRIVGVAARFIGHHRHGHVTQHARWLTLLVSCAPASHRSRVTLVRLLCGPITKISWVTWYIYLTLWLMTIAGSCVVIPITHMTHVNKQALKTMKLKSPEIHTIPRLINEYHWLLLGNKRSTDNDQIERYNYVNVRNNKIL